ncbi:hypothetical protein [Ensifer sp.]|jgi:hypothetical protein|nr:hypothetical protein [Ensifer sp.]
MAGFFVSRLAYRRRTRFQPPSGNKKARANDPGFLNAEAAFD